MPTRRNIGLLGLLIVAVLSGFAGTAHPASNSILIQMSVASVTSLDASGCPTGQAGVTNFGTVLPATSAITTGDCVVQYGSSNDTASLRLGQVDRYGSAMYRASSGVLDTTYDGSSGTADGDVTFTVSGLLPTIADGLQLPGGSTLLVGSLPSAPHRQLLVMKFRADGTLDPDFDGDSGTGNGVVTFDHYNDHDDGETVIVDSAGRILLGGSAHLPASAQRDIVVTRLLADGRLDTSFGGGTGRVRYSTNGTIGAGSNVDGARGLAIAPDGRIVVVGYGCNGSPCSYALRLLADGTLDPSFDGPQGNGNGWAVISSAGGPELTDVAVLADGSIVTFGRRTGPAEIELTKLLAADGSRDPAFDGASGTGNGQVLIDVPGAPYEEFRRMVVDSAGRYVLAGSTTYAAQGEALVARILPTGLLDPTFDGDSGSGNGIVQTDLTAGSSSDRLFGLTLQEDGAIVAVGMANGTAKVLRYLEDGRLDPVFDGPSGTSNGMVSLPLAWDGWQTPMYVGQGPDGTLVLSSRSDTVRRIVRLGSATVPDYGSGTWATGDFFGACLLSVAGGAPATGWTAASCPASDATPASWNGVAAGDTTVATTTAGVPATARLRFGIAAAAGRPPGAYRAPIAMTVVAPAI